MRARGVVRYRTAAGHDVQYAPGAERRVENLLNLSRVLAVTQVRSTFYAQIDCAVQHVTREARVLITYVGIVRALCPQRADTKHAWNNTKQRAQKRSTLSRASEALTLWVE